MGQNAPSAGSLKAAERRLGAASVWAGFLRSVTDVDLPHAWSDTELLQLAGTGLDVAACLEVASLPVDRRHNSKIDRTHLAEWATGVLEGGSVRNP